MNCAVVCELTGLLEYTYDAKEFSCLSCCTVVYCTVVNLTACADGSKFAASSQPMPAHFLAPCTIISLLERQSHQHCDCAIVTVSVRLVPFTASPNQHLRIQAGQTQPSPSVDTQSTHRHTASRSPETEGFRAFDLTAEGQHGRNVGRCGWRLGCASDPSGGRNQGKKVCRNAPRRRV